MLVVGKRRWGLGGGGGDIRRGRGDGVDHKLFFVDYYHCGREVGRKAVYKGKRGLVMGVYLGNSEMSCCAV